jgi:flavin-dependent dehydrogenase/ferredoxin
LSFIRVIRVIRGELIFWNERMSVAQYDVLVVGAGCAGLTAAIGLARSGFAVAVVEAAAQVGGGAALGGVCFAESLVQPDLLGLEGVEALAWERRLIERGSFATDGCRLTGSIYRDAEAFRHCYTVLRPLFDRHLAALARQHGVALLSETTVESLIREGRRIIGAATSRGALYAELIFLAEGDAGHLLSREGLDRSSNPRDRPAFLYCLQQVVELPSEAIDERFRLGAEQGAAYDFLLRNPLHSQLNARGILCTNRQGLTLSVILPAENLGQHFDGEPRQLLDRFVDMPALRPWLRDGRRGAWTATLLRTGGMRDVPYLVEDGLAVGGAAAGLGVDFPVLNLTGPATATGLLLSRAAARIRAEGRPFDRAALERHYLEPLQQTRYWRDLAFLQRWPGYLRRTHVLFESGLDLLLGSASVWMRARRWLPWKFLGWLGILSRVSWARWDELREDFIHVGRALRLREVMPRPGLGRLVLDGALNAFRDLVRQPRPHLPPRGTLRLYYHSAQEEGRASAVPALFRRWFERFRPVLASAGRILHENDDNPLSVKLTRTLDLLVRQINLLDLLAVAGLIFLILPLSTMLAAWGYLLRRRGERPEQPLGEREALAPCLSIQQGADAPRSPSSKKSGPSPQIHVLWRYTQPAQQAESVQGLPHICPAGVFEVRDATPRSMQVVVHAENCVFCEACWRMNPVVDWGRNGAPPSPPALLSPTETRLLDAEERAALVEPAAPRCRDPWQTAEHEGDLSIDTPMRYELETLLDRLECKLQEFDAVLARGAAIVDRFRNDHLEMLARYVHQLANRFREVLQECAARSKRAVLPRQALDLTDALSVRAEERTRRTWEGRFAWAAADGRLLRQHHLTGLRRLLGLRTFAEESLVSVTATGPTDWLPAALVSHGADACGKHLLADIAARRYLLATLEPNDGSPAEPVRADLLAALRVEAREGLLSRKAELNALLGTDAEQGRPPNSSGVAEAFQRHGSRLLANNVATHKLLDKPGDWPTLQQRRVLRAEYAEIAETEKRLLALASEWQEGYPHEPADENDVSGEFARQAAHVLAGKEMLLATFAWLEKGVDAELAIVLLRVWLDYTATLMNEFTILVRDRLNLLVLREDRPLVEPGSGAPLRTAEEYLSASSPYNSGDFLLLPVDLLQARLVPEMTGAADMDFVGYAAGLSSASWDKPAACPTAAISIAELLRLFKDLRDGKNILSFPPTDFYLAEAIVVETMGRCLRAAPGALDLEVACTRLILAELGHEGGALPERCIILRTLADEVVPRWLRGVDTGARHLERVVLELEALKADFRQRLTAVWQVFGEALGANADVQASCFALAEAAAWLKAADSALGRMAWFSRLCQFHERDEPALQQDVGRRGLRHCFAEIRDRLFRFDEDLASLRRGYYAPHVRAAALLLSPLAERLTLDG